MILVFQSETYPIMKISLLFVIVFFIFFEGFTQTFKPFRVELGMSFNAATGDEAGNGAGGYFEPRYAVNDQLLLGFRLESGYLSGGSITVNAQEVELNNTNLRARTFFGEYFFGTEKVRPFVGLAMGVFSRKSVGIAVNAGSVQIGALGDSRANFGIAPRAGINAGHWRFLATFNFTGEDISNYMGLNIGFEIGGGRKNKSKEKS